MEFKFKYIILESGEISIFKKIDLNDANVKKYKSKNKGLSHIRTGKDYKGYIYIDKNDNVIGPKPVIKSNNVVEYSRNYKGN